jgi:hypothetical protein
MSTIEKHMAETGHGTIYETYTGWRCRCGFEIDDPAIIAKNGGKKIERWLSTKKWEIGQIVNLAKRGIKVRVTKRTKSVNSDDFPAGIEPDGPAWWYEGERISNAD